MVDKNGASSFCGDHSFLQETVRNAADMACKSLHKVTVRACDVTTMSKTGEYWTSVEY